MTAYLSQVIGRHVLDAKLLRALSLISWALSATELQPAQAQAIEIPVTYHVSHRSFDECGWTCSSYAAPCYSWEYEWACTRNAGYDAGGDVLRFSAGDFEVLDLAWRIVHNFTADVDKYEAITACVLESINFPEVLLYKDSTGQVPPEQASDACFTSSECVERALYDYAHVMWYAQSWPPISVVPWYESAVNGDESGRASVVAFVNEVQRQVRFVNEQGEPNTYDYPQTWQYWGDNVIININRAYLDEYTQISFPCWNPELSGPSKYQNCDVNGDINDFSSCKHCTARHYAGTLVHELLHLMGHQHHAYGISTSPSYLDQTFIYTVGDCIYAYGDFRGTRNAAGSAVPAYSYDYEYFLFPYQN